MSKKEIPEILTIPGLRNGYETGSFSPRDVVKSVIERSAALAEKHIFITLPSMELIGPHLAELPPIDFEKYPLWGIPFAIKDNIDLAGAETTAACPAYAYQPEESATVVKKLLAAGAIPIGKTNLDQFATGLVGTRSPYGECKNSLAPDYISGGSSSGSAVATATGLCCFALGTDTAGSGRVPAALNELYGVKPSVGAYPKTGLVPACESLDCITVFAYRLDDAMLADSVIRGKCDEDMWSRDVPLTDGIPEKIIIPDAPLEFYGRFEEEYRQSYENAVKKLSEAFTVEKTDCNVFFKAAELLYGGPWICERWSALGGFVENHSESVFPVTREVLLSGKGGEYSAAALFEKQQAAGDGRQHPRPQGQVAPAVGGVLAPVHLFPVQQPQVQVEEQVLHIAAYAQGQYQGQGPGEMPPGQQGYQGAQQQGAAQGDAQQRSQGLKIGEAEVGGVAGEDLHGAPQAVHKTQKGTGKQGIFPPAPIPRPESPRQHLHRPFYTTNRFIIAEFAKTGKRKRQY